MRLSKGVPGHTFNPFDEFPGTATAAPSGHAHAGDGCPALYALRVSHLYGA